MSVCHPPEIFRCNTARQNQEAYSYTAPNTAISSTKRSSGSPAKRASAPRSRSRRAAPAQKSALGVGPKDGDARPIDPMAHLLGNVREILGTGTFFEDGEGNPFCTCILPAAGPKGLWPAVFKAG